MVETCVVDIHYIYRNKLYTVTSQARQMSLLSQCVYEVES